MKKKVIIFSSIVLFVGLIGFLFFRYFDGHCLELYINNGVLLSKTKNVEEIYSYEFREGEDFYIFHYDREKDIKRIIQKNRFKKITNNNLDKITKVLNSYRNDLCEKELSLFDKTTNIQDLAKIGNYYLYTKDELDDDDYFIQILFPKEKKYIILI